MQVSQWAPLRLSLQCERQARWSMSLELNGTHETTLLLLSAPLLCSKRLLLRAKASECLLLSPSPAFGVPSVLQNAQARHLHDGQTATASAGSHELLQLIMSRSPAIPE